MEGVREQGAQDGAVGCDGDGLARVRLAELADAAEGALLDDGERFAMRDDEAVGALEEVRQGVRPFRRDFVIRQTFPIAEVDLAKLLARLNSLRG